MTINPIETEYNGYRFRSRLEARWAVFFDALEIPYEYEAQGYTLDGVPYLPDFTLHTYGDRDDDTRSDVVRGPVIAEVKGLDVDEHEGRHVQLLRKLSVHLNCFTMLLSGPPGFRLYNGFAPQLPADAFCVLFFRAYSSRIAIVDDYWAQSISIDENTGAMTFSPNDDRIVRNRFGPQLVAAVNAARSARFDRRS